VNGEVGASRGVCSHEKMKEMGRVIGGIERDSEEKVVVWVWRESDVA